jgi:hypothetical protein
VFGERGGFARLRAARGFALLRAARGFALRARFAPRALFSRSRNT